jgi:hypothetical protein
VKLLNKRVQLCEGPFVASRSASYRCVHGALLSAQRPGVERPALEGIVSAHALMPGRSNGLLGAIGQRLARPESQTLGIFLG